MLLGIYCCLIYGQEIVLSGNQDSEFEFKLEQSITPFKGLKILTASFVIPGNFESPTYAQTISGVKFEFDPKPFDDTKETDKHGNMVRRLRWKAPQKKVKCTLAFSAKNSVALNPLQSSATFPTQVFSKDMEVYLSSTDQVQSDHPEILRQAHSLTREKETLTDAVRGILHFLVDHLRYDLFPEQYDALYAYQAKKGNCQNYSHLAAALMRAVNIPVRIVNGITLKKEYSIQVGQSEFSFEMAQGRHSWIEVYFPDIGWVPFDAQQTEFFVSNRYLRIEVGRDNEETIQDGMVKWTNLQPEVKGMPTLEELIDANFLTDNVTLVSEKKVMGPRKLLLTPSVERAAGLIAEVTPPVPIDMEREVSPDSEEQILPDSEILKTDFPRLTYDKPVTFGNLDFPSQFDFLSARFWGHQVSSDEGEIKRNFIVETAEYVTSNEQFAQVFTLVEPIILKKIGVPLHVFGGLGFLWLEISEDQNGQPGEPAARSGKIQSQNIRIPKGYDWVDFNFSTEGLLLTPGRYWFSLRYSSSPIVNWFYSYGKPVGPVDGTRSRDFGKKTWEKVLSYEFNYRIIALGAKEYRMEK
jgi:hypothetical protein